MNPLIANEESRAKIKTQRIPFRAGVAVIVLLTLFILGISLEISQNILKAQEQSHAPNDVEKYDMNEDIKQLQLGKAEQRKQDQLARAKAAEEQLAKERAAQEQLARKKAVEEQQIKEQKAAEASRQQDHLNNPEQYIRSILGCYVGNVGLVYLDLSTGKTLTINGDKEFTAASTVKVPMNMVLYDMIGEGKINVNEKLKYTAANYEGGTGILQSQNLSNPIPLKTLSEYSITHSDNIATNMLMSRIGYETMRQRIDQKTGRVTDHGRNVMSANDASKLLKQLYSGAKTNNYYANIINYMKHTDFHDRIDRDLDHGIVAHKIGNYGSFINDISIVYSVRPYILVVYSDSVKNANEKIAEISDFLYKYNTQTK